MRHSRRMLQVISTALTIVAVANGVASAADTPCNIVLVSKPQGASIVMDGETIGTTPLSLYGKPPGKHKIEMILEGYPNWSKEVTFRPGFNTVSAIFEKESEASAEPPVDADDTPKAEDVADDEPEKSDAVPKYIEIDCLWCRGQGLMTSIGCSACSAVGSSIRGNERQDCTVCSGSARVPYTCQACKGEGELTTSSGRKVPCPRCKGKGSPPCTVCKGHGKLKRPNPDRANYETEPCAPCKGTGCVLETVCKRCSGKGEVTISTNVNNVVNLFTLKCADCRGKGQRPTRCSQCSGKGYLGSRKYAKPCVVCAGTGNQYPRCPDCRGAGWIRTRKRK